jgi:hypothetical protein
MRPHDPGVGNCVPRLELLGATRALMLLGSVTSTVYYRYREQPGPGAQGDGCARPHDRPDRQVGGVHRASRQVIIEDKPEQRRCPNNDQGNSGNCLKQLPTSRCFALAHAVNASACDGSAEPSACVQRWTVGH